MLVDIQKKNKRLDLDFLKHTVELIGRSTYIEADIEISVTKTEDKELDSSICILVKGSNEYLKLLDNMIYGCTLVDDTLKIYGKMGAGLRTKIVVYLLPFLKDMIRVDYTDGVSIANFTLNKALEVDYNGAIDIRECLLELHELLVPLTGKYKYESNDRLPRYHLEGMSGELELSGITLYEGDTLDLIEKIEFNMHTIGGFLANGVVMEYINEIKESFSITDVRVRETNTGIKFKLVYSAITLDSLTEFKRILNRLSKLRFNMQKVNYNLVGSYSRQLKRDSVMDIINNSREIIRSTSK